MFVRDVSDALDVYVYEGMSRVFRLLVSIKELLDTLDAYSNKNTL